MNLDKLKTHFKEGQFTLAGSLAILAILFLVLTMVNNTLFSNIRWDMTENKLYTLSPGSQKLLNNINEPINLYFFFSERLSEDYPPLRTYAKRVQEFLQEYALLAGDRIRLQIIDPEPFSEAEDRANQFGLQGIPVDNSGDKLYFGLAGSNSMDGVETIPFFTMGKEAFLEYDLSKLIYTLAHPKKPVIGLLSGLPVQGGFNPATRQPTPPWVFMEQLQSLFDIETLSGNMTVIDDKVDILLLIHPQNLSETALYAIDQFVLNGGKAMIFVDPHAQIAQSMGLMGAGAVSSNLPRLFEAWGIEMTGDQAVADGRYGLSVSNGPGLPPTRHLGILGLEKAVFADDDPIIGELSHINLAVSGYFNPIKGTTTRLQPLMQSSNMAMPFSVDDDTLLMNPEMLLNRFAATGKRYTVAARLQGEAQSAFDKAPERKSGEKKSATEKTPPLPHQSKGPINLIVVADTDILSDRLWVRKQNFLGQTLTTAWANNGDFAINGLDNLGGNADLIGIRGHAVVQRPFTTVENLKRQAEQRFKATEQELQKELEDTEQQLAQLQENRQDQDSLIMTPEQQEALQRFQEKKLAIRKQLRQVRRNLDKNIEDLGTTLKIVNIGLMPLILTGLVVGGIRLRRKRKRSNSI